MKKVIVSDVTLKSEAVKGLTFKDKMKIAGLIDLIGADFIELPAYSGSREDEIILTSIAESVKNAVVTVTAKADEASVIAACKTAKKADKARIQIEIPTSTVNMEYEYHIKAPKMPALAEKMISLAAAEGVEIELSLRDASRAEPEFIALMAKTAEKSGASAITLCDDAGLLMPKEAANLVKAAAQGFKKDIYIQLTDIIGMANASAAAAASAGAAGVKTVFAADGLDAAGFGELVRIKGEDIGIKTSLDCTVLKHTKDKIKNIISGETTREASVSLSGALDAEIRLTSESTLEDVKNAAEKLGFDLSGEDIGRANDEIKRVARKKQSVGQRELEAIIASSCMQAPSAYHLESYISNSGNIIPATANITLIKDGEKLSGVASGDGPIDAAFRAIEIIIGHHYELDDFKITSVTEGREAVGSAIVKLRDGGRLYSGNGVSTDIIGASVRAYINALNKIVYGDN